MWNYIAANSQLQTTEISMLINPYTFGTYCKYWSCMQIHKLYSVQCGVKTGNLNDQKSQRINMFSCI